MTDNITRVSAYGLYADLINAVKVVTAANGCPIVQVPPGVIGGPITTIASHNADGIAINIPGATEASSNIDRGTFPPMRKVYGGDVVILFKDSGFPGGTLWTSNYPKEGSQSRSKNSASMAIAFVDYEPQEGQLFPPAVGDYRNPFVSFGRGLKILPEHIKIDKLPSILRLGDIDLTTDNTTVEQLYSTFHKFCGDVWSNWSTDENTPALQHPGYGRELAQWVSRWLLYLISDAPASDKMKLAIPLCEWGLTLAGAFTDGRFNFASGGHCQGRTPIIIMAGYLLDIPAMMDMRWLGNVFQERQMWYNDGRSWWNDSTWKSFWQRTSDHRFGDIPEPWDQPPATWNDHVKWALSYYFHSAGANIGTAIVMRLLNLEDIIGKDFVKGILDQYMGNMSPEARLQMRNAGINDELGTEYPKPWFGDGFQKQAFDQLRADGKI